MSKIDEMISGALTAEDRALLASHGEAGYLAQAFGLFRGPMAAVMWLVYVTAGIAFLVGAYAFWQMWGSADALAAVKWGVVSLFLFQVAALCKSFMGNQMQANRMLRELKRMELQLALLRPGTGPSA
jgi:hypothetical protein